jgi:hypothetical protein
MSDAPQGPDWWQASDDKWYPPPRPEMPGDVPASRAPVGAEGYAPPGVPPGPPLGPPPTGGYGPSGGFPPGGPPPPGAGYPSGPYGAPGAPGGPPGPGQNRTPLFIALGALAAVALIGLIVVISSGGGDDDDAPHRNRPVTTHATTTDAPTTESPGPTDTSDPGTGGPTVQGTTDVGQLALVDQGFSVSDDGGSYGIVIANNGTETVTNFEVQVAVYDNNNTVVTTDHHLVAKLGPAEQLGIGYDILTDDAANGVGRLDVQFEEGFGDSVPEGAFSISEVSTSTDEFSTETTFVVTSTYAQDLDSPYAYVIYRDAAGKIIGGTYGFVDMIPANGRASGTLTSFDPVDGVATSEVYVDAGFFM